MLRKIAFLFVFFSFSAAYAQVNVSEKTIELSKKEKRNGFQIFMPAEEAESKAVENVIEKRFKAWKARYKESSGIYRAEKVVIEAISDKQIDLIISAQKDKKGDYIIAAIIGVGYDQSATSTENPAESSKIKAILTQMYQEIKEETIKQKLAVETEKLADLEKSLKKMQSNQTDWQKDIENYTKKIEEAKSNMTKNERSMQDMQTKIAEQRKAVEALKAK